jgi:2-keto-3-deoxy-6-phosphogluconate aldolase
VVSPGFFAGDGGASAAGRRHPAAVPLRNADTNVVGAITRVGAALYHELSNVGCVGGTWLAPPSPHRTGGASS